jgi:hypothetical protein
MSSTDVRRNHEQYRNEVVRQMRMGDKAAALEAYENCLRCGRDMESRGDPVPKGFEPRHPDTF